STLFSLSMTRRPPASPLFPYTTLFRSPTKGSTAYLASSLTLREGHPLQPYQAVRVRLEALDVRPVREEQDRVVQVDYVPVGQVALERLPVEVVPGLGRRGRARLVQQPVDLLVAVARLVQRPLAGVELVDVAVGVDAARPAHGEGRVLALLLEVEGGGELGRAQGDVEADLAGQRLDDLADPYRLGVVRDHHLELDAVDAGLVEQGPGALDVARGYGHLGHVPRARWGHGLVADHELAAEDDVVDRVPV